MAQIKLDQRLAVLQMTGKKPALDDATIAVMRRMLNTPPKPHDEMKVGRPVKKKKRGPKARASSAKRRTA